MNKRLDIVARAMLSLAIGSEDNPDAKVKTSEEYRADAAVLLTAIDMFMFSTENVEKAIIDAGYEPAEYMEQFNNVIKELNSQEVENPRFFAFDMEKAWAKGHENGFWDARQTDAVKPSPVIATESKSIFSSDDLKNAEAQGYVSGWHNGILSQAELPDSLAEMPLLGAEHGKATNPYSAQNLANEAVRKGTEGHALWCAGDHEGECQRGRVTGTEGSADND